MVCSVSLQKALLFPICKVSGLDSKISKDFLSLLVEWSYFQIWGGQVESIFHREGCVYVHMPLRC